MEIKESEVPSENKIVDACGELLKNKKLSIAFAESATAGRVMADFSLIEKAGEFLKGGLVCYNVCIKEHILGVPPDLIKQYTAESAEVTEALAKGLKSFIKADVHIAVTGLTSVGGSETESKPVGTMFIHFLYKDKDEGDRKFFSGNGKSIIEQTVNHIASRLLIILND